MWLSLLLMGVLSVDSTRFDEDLNLKLNFFMKLLEERFLVNTFGLLLVETERGEEVGIDACELAD